MASLCERGEAFITCHCDLFAPWTGFKREPTNFIGVNLATFSRTLYGMEPLTLHFSFEISKERERECVCVCARGREEEEVFSSRPSMRIIHGVRGWGGKRRKWKIEKLVSQVRWSRRWSSALIFFMEDVKSVCCEENWRREKGIEFIFIDLLWQKDTFRRFQSIMDHMENIWILFIQESLFLYAKIWMKCIWNIDYRWSIFLHR